MKTFEELTPMEKDKLMTYWTIKGSLWMRFTILIALSYVGLFIGIPFIMLPHILAFFIGFLIMLMSAAILIIVIVNINTSLKYLQLAFDTEDSFEDIFDIKKSDIRNMRRRWIKVK